MKLTQRRIEDLECPAGKKDMLVFDDEQRGLGVRVTASGGGKAFSRNTPLLAQSVAFRSAHARHLSGRGARGGEAVWATSPRAATRRRTQGGGFTGPSAQTP